jgi:hypothetical protein
MAKKIFIETLGHMVKKGFEETASKKDLHETQKQL